MFNRQMVIGAIAAAALGGLAFPASAGPVSSSALATAGIEGSGVKPLLVHRKKYRHRHWRRGRAWWHGGPRFRSYGYGYGYNYPYYYGWGPGITLHFGDRHRGYRHRRHWRY